MSNKNSDNGSSDWKGETEAHVAKEAPAATALQTATTAVCQMDKYHQCYFNINKDLTLSSSQISVLCEHSTTVVTFV